MRLLFVAAVSGLLLTGSSALAQTQAKTPPRPSYNMQKPTEDIGPFAGGAKTHRTSVGKAPAAGKARKVKH